MIKLSLSLNLSLPVMFCCSNVAWVGRNACDASMHHVRNGVSCTDHAISPSRRLASASTFISLSKEKIVYLVECKIYMERTEEHYRAEIITFTLMLACDAVNWSWKLLLIALDTLLMNDVSRLPRIFLWAAWASYPIAHSHHWASSQLTEMFPTFFKWMQIAKQRHHFVVQCILLLNHFRFFFLPN